MQFKLRGSGYASLRWSRQGAVILETNGSMHALELSEEDLNAALEGVRGYPR